ncbi:MAG: hypothetical protein ACYC69_02945 [Thermodesulfovibrionales bacterium]
MTKKLATAVAALVLILTAAVAPAHAATIDDRFVCAEKVSSSQFEDWTLETCPVDKRLRTIAADPDFPIALSIKPNADSVDTLKNWDYRFEFGKNMLDRKEGGLLTFKDGVELFITYVDMDCPRPECQKRLKYVDADFTWKDAPNGYEDVKSLAWLANEDYHVDDWKGLVSAGTLPGLMDTAGNILNGGSERVQIISLCAEPVINEWGFTNDKKLTKETPGLGWTPADIQYSWIFGTPVPTGSASVTKDAMVCRQFLAWSPNGGFPDSQGGNNSNWNIKYWEFQPEQNPDNFCRTDCVGVTDNGNGTYTVNPSCATLYHDPAWRTTTYTYDATPRYNAICRSYAWGVDGSGHVKREFEAVIPNINHPYLANNISPQFISHDLTVQLQNMSDSEWAWNFRDGAIHNDGMFYVNTLANQEGSTPGHGRFWDADGTNNILAVQMSTLPSAAMGAWDSQCGVDYKIDVTQNGQPNWFKDVHDFRCNTNNSLVGNSAGTSAVNAVPPGVTNTLENRVGIDVNGSVGLVPQMFSYAYPVGWRQRTNAGNVGLIIYTRATTDKGTTIAPMSWDIPGGTPIADRFTVFADIDNGYTRITNTLNRVFFTPPAQ